MFLRQRPAASHHEQAPRAERRHAVLAVTTSNEAHALSHQADTTLPGFRSIVSDRADTHDLPSAFDDP